MCYFLQSSSRCPLESVLGRLFDSSSIPRSGYAQIVLRRHDAIEDDEDDDDRSDNDALRLLSYIYGT